MLLCGFRRKLYIKSYFVDGHEREDVKDYRENVFYLKCKRMRQYAGDKKDVEISIELSNGLEEIVWLYQDESTIYANDCHKFEYVDIDEVGDIRQKSLGSSLMVSAFMCPCHGIMQSILHPGRVSYKIIKAGKNRDGYWTNNNLVDQLKNKARNECID